MVFDQRVLKRKHAFSETAKTKELHQPPSARGSPSKQRWSKQWRKLPFTAAVQLFVRVHVVRASCMLHAPVSFIQSCMHQDPEQPNHGRFHSVLWEVPRPHFTPLQHKSFCLEPNFLGGVEYKCFAGQDILLIICREEFYIFCARRGTFSLNAANLPLSNF